MKKVKYLILSFLENYLSLKYLPKVTFKTRGREIVVSKDVIRSTENDDVWFRQICDKSKRVFDLGCNVGEYSLYAGLSSNIEHCLAVDANPKAIQVCVENIASNFINTVDFYCGFVGDDSKESHVDFWFAGHGGASSRYSSMAGTARELESKIKVPVVSLMYLAERYGVPDFIKVDVEGAEYDVIKGGLDVLRKNRIKLLVEVHSAEELSFIQNLTQIIETAKSIGYETWHLPSKKVISEVSEIKKVKRDHVFLIPEGYKLSNYIE